MQTEEGTGKGKRMTSNRVCIESTLCTTVKNVTKEMEWVMGYKVEDDEPYP